VNAIRAAITVVAAILSFLTVYALGVRYGVGAQPAIVAAVLAITLARRASPVGRAQLVLQPLTIAAVAPVAGGVGWLLLHVPVVGATVFTVGMFLSIWLRNFGARGKSVGALVALPLLAILIVPVRLSPGPAGRLVDLGLLVAAGLIALLYVSVLKLAARRVGVPFAEEAVDAEGGEPPVQRSGVSASTRMAVQMAVALTSAFVAGALLFPGHDAWTVLTAFIVCSGARGRGDALYKGVLRLVGAVVGTMAAAAVSDLWAPRGVTEAVAIFAMLFLGIWLRERNYAYWAACMTLILALLGSATGLSVGLLGVRLEAILLGAVCAVVAAWFVLPIRTESVVRKRLADALLALDELIAHAHLPDGQPAAKLARFEHRMTELDGVAPPVRWHRRIFASRSAGEHPARWIELAGGLRSHAREIGARGGAQDADRKSIRRAIGISRRAIANHGKPPEAREGPSITAALDTLHETFETRNPGLTTATKSAEN
jgi:hypothetical protein